MDVIETTRLILRPFTLDDAEDLYEYARDFRVGPAAGWLPHESAAYSERIIETVFSAPGTAAMALRGTGKVVGSVGFVGRSCDRLPGPDDEIGYSLRYECWGRGLMTEAVRAVIAYGFSSLGLETIWCNHDRGNERSRRVISACGFTYRFSEKRRIEAMRETRLTLCYALTRAEWVAGHG